MDPKKGARTRLRQELLEDGVVAEVREIKVRPRNAVDNKLLLTDSMGPMREAGLALEQL